MNCNSLCQVFDKTLYLKSHVSRRVGRHMTSKVRDMAQRTSGFSFPGIQFLLKHQQLLRGDLEVFSLMFLVDHRLCGFFCFLVVVCHVYLTCVSGLHFTCFLYSSCYQGRCVCVCDVTQKSSNSAAVFDDQLFLFHVFLSCKNRFVLSGFAMQQTVSFLLLGD